MAENKSQQWFYRARQIRIIADDTKTQAYRDFLRELAGHLDAIALRIDKGELGDL